MFYFRFDILLFFIFSKFGFTKTGLQDGKTVAINSLSKPVILPRPCWKADRYYVTQKKQIAGEEVHIWQSKQNTSRFKYLP